jgi:hypothetical protein
VPETRPVPVKDLALDLGNYRTSRQASEVSAVEAMISTSPDRFWALAESLLQDGYLPTETVIVLRNGPAPGKLTVKEGNRRVAVLKLIHGHLPLTQLSVPDAITTQIGAVPAAWRRDNNAVPCAIRTRRRSNSRSDRDSGSRQRRESRQGSVERGSPSAPQPGRKRGQRACARPAREVS